MVKKKESTFTKLKNAYGNDGHIDYIFLAMVVFLFCFGLIMMFSASYASAIQKNHSGAYYLFSQLPKSLFGVALMLVLANIDYKIFNSSLATVLYFVTLALLLLALILNSGGGDQDVSRWIDLGFIDIQPSEIAKFTLIIVLAYCMCVLKNPLRTPFGQFSKLTLRKDRTNSLERFFFTRCRTQISALFLLFMVVASYCFLILLEKHVSATIVVLAIGFTMIVLSGADKRIFLALIAIAVVIVVVVIIEPDVLDILPGFARSRVSAWVDKDNPEFKEQRRQTVNSLYAIASGGLFGVGFGKSTQKQLYLPEPQNDFVFPILVEELGFLGAFITIAAFAFLIYRGYKIAMRCNDLFGSLVVMGIMNQIALQVIINIAVVTDVFPNTGMPLPFFSYGGSAVMILLAEMGVVLSISKSSQIEKN